MSKEANTAYRNYMDALDAGIEIARKRALTNIYGGASVGELLDLDRQYLQAKMQCDRKRDAWVVVRDAHFADDEE